MPLESRLNRKPVSASAAAQAPAQEPQDISPRRRGVAPEPAPEPTPPADESAASAEGSQEEQTSPVPPAADELTSSTGAEDSKDAPAPAPTRSRGRPAKAAVELPPEAATSDDPAVLREVLKGIEGDIRAARQEYEQRSKELIARYQMVAGKLATQLAV